MPVPVEMKSPAYIIDPPSPYDPRDVWWEFLRQLRHFDPNDPAVQAAREDAIRYLVVSEEGERTENS